MIDEAEMRLNIIENLARIMGITQHHNKNDIKVTLLELSKKTGIPRNTLKKAKYEGQGGLFTFAKIADALNIKIDDLLKYPEKTK